MVLPLNVPDVHIGSDPESEGEFPNLRILATVYSPYLLDCLRPEETRFLTLGEDRSSICGRPNQHPEFEQRKDPKAPGEQRNLFGQKWLLQGGAVRCGAVSRRFLVIQEARAGFAAATELTDRVLSSRSSPGPRRTAEITDETRRLAIRPRPQTAGGFRST